MVAGISFGGLASGLDTDSIIAALVAVEQRPITLMQAQKSTFQSQQDAFKKLEDLLKTLESATEKLADPDKFLAYKAEVEDETYFTANSTGDSPVGSYHVNVESLASSTLLRTPGFESLDTPTLQGTITVNVGDESHEIVIGSDNDDFGSIKDAIDAIDGVSAYTVFDGDLFHLEIRGDKAGVDNAVSIDEDLLAFSVSEEQSAADATFSINGLDYRSADNVVEDAIPGLSLNLLQTHDSSSDTTTITIAEDFEEIENQVQEFIDAYNAIADFFNDQSEFTINEEGEEPDSAPLFGDLSLRMLRNEFSRKLTTIADDSLGLAVNSLASIGITTDSNGKLELDSETFQESLAGNLDDVRTLFTDANDGEDDDFVGIATALLETIELRTDRVDGLIKTRTDSIDRLIQDLDKRIRDSEDRLVTYEESLVRRYASFETLISQLQSQGNALTAITSSS